MANKKNKNKNNNNTTSETSKENIKTNENNKEIKKQTIDKARKNLIYSKNDSSDEITKLVKIIIIVTAIMGVFYLVTVFVTRKADAVKTASGRKSEKAVIQYDSIIIGSMLKIDGSYYVLIKDEKDNKSSEYDTLLQMIAANDEASKVYTANLTESFNHKYLGKEKNYDSDLSKFTVTGTTLVKIEDHNIKDTYDTYESIKEELENLK